MFHINLEMLLFQKLVNCHVTDVYTVFTDFILNFLLISFHDLDYKTTN